MTGTSAPKPLVLLDRRRVLREVDALLREAQAGGSAAVVRIAGPAGIGKTSVLSHLAARLSGPKRRLYSTAARPDDHTKPAACIRRLLRAAVRSGADEGTLLRALIDELDARTILCIDDVQWLDEVSGRILRTVVRSHPTLTVLLGDRRENGPELPKHTSVHLVPLRNAAAVRLVHNYYPNAPPAVTSEIVAAAAGLPFGLAFLAERAVRESARHGDDIDPSLGVTIAKRLEGCSIAAREAIRYAACLDGPVELRRLGRALNTDIAVVAKALTELHDLVTVENLRLVFRHAKVSEAVLAAVPDAFPYYCRLLAVSDADDHRSPEVAIRLKCARACGEHEVAANCALELGRLLAAAGALETALDHLVTAIHQTSRPLMTRYALEYAGVLQQLARDVEAASFLRDELRFATERADAVAAADLLSSYFSAALTLERFTELDALCGRVEAMAATDKSVLGRIRSVRIAAFAFSGALDDFDTLTRVAPLDWVDRRPSSFVAALRGNREAARNDLEAYQSALASEHLRQVPTDRILRATIGLFEIGVSALAELDRDDVSAVEQRNPSMILLRVLHRLSDARWEEAQRILGDISLWDRSDEEPYGILDVRLLSCALAKRAPDSRRTLRSLRTLIARGQVRHAVSPARWYVAAVHAAGKSPSADIASFVEDTLDVSTMPYMLAALPLQIALLQPVLGRSRCVAALDRWPHFDSRWHRAHQQLARGLLECRNEDLREARDSFDALGAPVFGMLGGMALPVARARDAAIAAMLFAERAPLPSLTARERDIAELVAQDQSNRDIASRLGISERTVEVHLTNAFRKLGVRSRSGLAQRVLRT